MRKINFLRLSLVIAVFLTLPSCQKPANKLPANPKISATWREIENDDLIKTNKEVLSKIHYSKFFQNPEMIDLIEIGVENNRDLKIALLKIQSAFDYYRIKRANLLPKLSATANASKTKVSQNSLARFGVGGSTVNSFIVNNYEANLASASFELDLFNKLKYINEAAFQDFLAKVENQNAVRISLTSQIANGYIQWISDLELLKIAKQKVKLEEEYYKLTRVGYKNGLNSKTTLLRAKSSLDLARSDFAAVKNISGHDKNALIVLLGAQNDEKIKAISFDGIKLNDDFYVDLSSDVLLLRPDVMSSEYQLKSQEANIKVARASFFPSISLTGTYGFASNKLSNLISSSSSGTWNVGAGIDIPIFSGFKNMANLKMQKTERKIAIENYQKAIQGAFIEVSNKLITRKSLKIDLASKKNIAKSNKEILKIDQKFFDLGSKNKIELMDSQRSNLAAKSEKITSQKKFLINQIELYKALGGGFIKKQRKEAEKGKLD